MKKAFSERCMEVAANWAVYGTIIGIYSVVPYYVSLLHTADTIKALGISLQQMLLLLLGAFSIKILLFPSRIPFRETRIYSTMLAIRLLAAGVIFRGIIPVLPQKEKVSILLLIVKFFYVPLMMSFFFGNIRLTIDWIDRIFSHQEAFSAEIIFTSVYPLLLCFMLAIDTGVFLAGYLIESSACGNVVKSVEDTALGWFFALICYPPFNDIAEALFGWNASHLSSFGHAGVDIVMGGAAVAFMAVYVWSSVSLGLKASNLTNRGIVSSGPYRFVRHPAYVGKNLSWWIASFPIILFAFFDICANPFQREFSVFAHHFFVFIAAVATPAAWTFIYYMRALTEERHLMRDPEYRAYAERVKWRFFPGWF